LIGVVVNIYVFMHMITVNSFWERIEVSYDVISNSEILVRALLVSNV
jgi:hypothetical protein